MKVEISMEPTEADIAELIQHILPADAVEVAATGLALEDAIRNSIAMSDEVYVIRGDGDLGSIIGIIGSDATAPARPWMLSTNKIVTRPKEVLKLSRAIFAQWSDRYGYMSNYVDQRHTRAVHWLRWLGARFTPETFGPYSRPFYLFEFGEP
jgi:hypothetical protein